MGRAKLLLGILAFSTMAACTPGTPEIVATEKLAAIELDQKQFQSKSLDTFDVHLSGRVVRFVERLEVSLDNGNNWEPLSGVQSSSFNMNLNDCSGSCPFNMTLENVGEKWSQVRALGENSSLQVLLRGQSPFGSTNTVSFEIKKLKVGMFSVGTLSLNQIGAKVKTLSSGLQVRSGRLEAKGVGVIQ